MVKLSYIQAVLLLVLLVIHDFYHFTIGRVLEWFKSIGRCVMVNDSATVSHTEGEVKRLIPDGSEALRRLTAVIEQIQKEGITISVGDGKDFKDIMHVRIGK